MLEWLDVGLDPETGYSYRAIAYWEVDGHFVSSEPSNVANARTLSSTVFEDDFEDYDLNAPPDNEAYTVDQQGASTLLVDDEEFHEGEQALNFSDPRDQDGDMCRLWITTRPMAKGTISFWANIADNGSFGIIGASPDDIITFQLQFNDDNTFAFRDGAQFRFEGEEYPVDEWAQITFEFDFTTHLYSVYFNLDRVVDEARLQNDNLVSNSLFILLGYSNTTIEHVYVDDLSFEEFPVDDERINSQDASVLPAGLKKVSDYYEAVNQDR